MRVAKQKLKADTRNINYKVDSPGKNPQYLKAVSRESLKSPAV